MRLLSLCLCAFTTVVAFSGCDNDTTAPQDVAFSVVLTVTDRQGEPVAGVKVASMPAVPEWFWTPPEGGPSTPRNCMVGFSLEQATAVRLEVRDVTGAVVRVLVDDVLPAGQHDVLWRGLDDANQPRPGGWYTFHVAYDDHVLETPFILAVCDPEWYTLGITDGQGRLVIDDQTTVPAFWTPEAVEGVVLTTETLLRLEDASGAGNYATFTAIAGPQTAAVIWQPQPVPFAIALTILEADGETPVANARVGGLPAVPEWALSAYLSRSAVRIPMVLEVSAPVLLTVQDVTGRTIRTLVDGVLSWGRHEITWDGRDDDHQATPPGWYQVRMLATPAGEPAIADSVGILQANYTLDLLPWGTTDSQGRVRLADRRLVPGLRDLPPVVATDESGEVVGTFDLTARTYLFLGYERWVVLDNLIDGWQSVTAMVQDSPFSPVPAARGRGEPDILPPSVRLLPPYPNPFN